MCKATLAWAVCAGVTVGAAGVAEGVQIRLHMPGINGADDVPGYPDAFAVQSLKIEPGGVITVVKPIDSASPGLFLGAAQGTHFLNSTVLLHNPPPTGQPVATMGLSDVLISGYQQGAQTEQVVLSNAGGPGSIFLVLPGIAGEDGVPGYPNAIRIDSFTLTADSFEFVRPVDSASPAIVAAGLGGTVFPLATVLFYDGQDGGLSPAAEFYFQQVLVSSYQTSGGGASPAVETVSMNFAEVVFPEPTGLAVAGVGMMVAGVCGRSRRRRGGGSPDCSC